MTIMGKSFLTNFFTIQKNNGEYIMQSRFNKFTFIFNSRGDVIFENGWEKRSEQYVDISWYGKYRKNYEYSDKGNIIKELYRWKG